MKTPTKYEPMSEQCNIFLNYALTYPGMEMPVALDDACDLLTTLRAKGRAVFVAIFGRKIESEMDEADDFIRFWDALSDELNEMETELGDQCPWLDTIMGLKWINGWEGVRNQPLSAEEKTKIAALWGKGDPERIARSHAEEEKDDDDDKPVDADADDEDADVEVVERRVAVGT